MSTTKKLAVGQQVLVKFVSLSFSDYKNLPGEVINIHGDFLEVAVPKHKIAVEDLRDLKKENPNSDRYIVKVKSTNLS